MLFYQQDGATECFGEDRQGGAEGGDRRVPRFGGDVNPAFPFSYEFFTDEYEQLFRDDEEFSAILLQFTFIAIVIACLGLYGLSSFSADRKTKEIGHSQGVRGRRWRRC